MTEASVSGGSWGAATVATSTETAWATGTTTWVSPLGGAVMSSGTGAGNLDWFRSQEQPGGIGRWSGDSACSSASQQQQPPVQHDIALGVSGGGVTWACKYNPGAAKSKAAQRRAKARLGLDVRLFQSIMGYIG